MAGSISLIFWINESLGLSTLETGRRVGLFPKLVYHDPSCGKPTALAVGGHPEGTRGDLYSSRTLVRIPVLLVDRAAMSPPDPVSLPVDLEAASCPD